MPLPLRLWLTNSASTPSSLKLCPKTTPQRSGHGYCVIVDSEGSKYPDGRFLAEAGTKDAFGHTQLGGVGPVVANMVREHGYCTVIVSEGCHHPDGTFLAEQGTKDAFGHAQLGGAAPVVGGMVKKALGHKFHWAVADYLQRAARHIASPTDVRQAYDLGAPAVELALQGHTAVMPTIERVADKPYRYRIGMAPLAKVANVEKNWPDDF